MKIEEFLNSKKAELDNHEPDINRMWANINNEMNHKEVRRMQFVKWIAASVLVLITVGALVRHELIMQEQITSLSQINEELAKREQDYSSQVSQKWTEYNQMEGNSSPMETMLIDELKQLDTLYQKGLDDIKNQGYNERAIIIMLETYEKRLRIIEKLIYEKEKHIRYENRDRKVDI